MTITWPAATALDETHDPCARSWVDGADGHEDFPVQNLPLGVLVVGGSERIACAIGDYALDLSTASSDGILQKDCGGALATSSLNALFGMPSSSRREVRRRIFALLTDPSARILVERHLLIASDCPMALPFTIGDYTDFYAGIRHAENVGRLFRPDNPLLPNYKHVPIGYHGRASSVSVSGTPVVRPFGQVGDSATAAPSFRGTARLDHEVELGIWIGGSNAMGTPVPIAEARTRVAGMCLLNDWSARDVQAWEYQPLGPFLSKSFATTVSPWVVTADALEPFRTMQPARPEGDPVPLAYLSDADDQSSGSFAVSIEAHLSTPAMRAQGIVAHRLSRASMADLYWTAAQLVAHHSSNGCPLNTGDLLGTGTISGAEPDMLGSMMELTSGGVRPVELPGGETRYFLEDGDEIVLTARAEKPGSRSIGFGHCSAIVQASTVAQ